MPEFKVTLRAEADIDIWIEADDATHAETLAKANNPETYSRVRSAVTIGSGSIRVDTPTITVNSVEEVL